MAELPRLCSSGAPAPDSGHYFVVRDRLIPNGFGAGAPNLQMEGPAPEPTDGGLIPPRPCSSGSPDPERVMTPNLQTEGTQSRACSERARVFGAGAPNLQREGPAPEPTDRGLVPPGPCRARTDVGPFGIRRSRTTEPVGQEPTTIQYEKKKEGGQFHNEIAHPQALDETPLRETYSRTFKSPQVVAILPAAPT